MSFFRPSILRSPCLLQRRSGFHYTSFSTSHAARLWHSTPKLIDRLPPRVSRQQVYAAKNKALLMYTSAVVCLFISKELVKLSLSLDRVRCRSDLRSGPPVPNVLRRDRIRWNAKSRDRKIRTRAAGACGRCTPIQSPFQCRPFRATSVDLYAPTEVRQCSTGRV